MQGVQGVRCPRGLRGEKGGTIADVDGLQEKLDELMSKIEALQNN